MPERRDVRLLGPLDVVVDGRHVALGGTKQRAVLGVLALRRGDVVSIAERSKNQLRIQDSLHLAEKVGFPSWVEVDPKKMTGTYKGAPERSEFGQDINESLVVELYSK